MGIRGSWLYWAEYASYTTRNTHNDTPLFIELPSKMLWNQDRKHPTPGTMYFICVGFDISRQQKNVITSAHTNSDTNTIIAKAHAAIFNEHG